MEDNSYDNIPFLMRHNTSGVWVGFVKGKGMFPNTIRVEGRRIWSWEGGRLECSQLAKQGCTAQDRLGEWETVEIGSMEDELVEFRVIEKDVVLAAKELPADGAA